MALKGELLSADLSNVFQMLAMNGKRGLLSVQDRVNPVARRRFFLDAQTVYPADPTAKRPSLPLLVEMGRVTYEQYASAQQRAKRFNSDPWGILEAQGTVNAEDVEAFRSRAANEALLEVFLWRDIRFSLDENVTRAPIQDAPSIQLDHVIMEAARRQDEWQHIVAAVGSHREVFRRCQTTVDLSDLGGVERIVYDYVDGVDSTPDIVAKSDLPRYFVDLGLASLLKRGLVSRLNPEELIMSGDRLADAGHMREAIRLFHGALRSDRSNIEIHKRLAAAHVKGGEYGRACGHLRYCSVLRLNEGQRRESLALLHEAWSLLPTQFSTLERILSILADAPRGLTKEDRGCLSDGRKLLQVWHDTGELERAVDLAARLWSIDQSDREVLQTAARLNLRLGRIDAATEAYEVVAERMRAENNPRGALEVYRTIASFSGAAAGAYERKAEELKRELARSTSKKARSRHLKWVVVGTLAGGILWGGYAWYGEQVLRDLEKRLESDPTARDARAADFRAAAFWFGLAPAAATANARAATLTADADRERDELRAKNEAVAARLSAETKAADDAVAEGLRMVKAGDLAGAMERLKSGLDSFPSRESQAASRAAKALADVERYLAQGRELLEEARAVELSDPDAAFRLRLKALRDFELLPEARTLKLTLRIDAVPPDARLFVAASGEEHTAPIGIEVGGQGLLAIEARAPGFLTRSFTTPLPPEVASWTLVLERAPSSARKMGDPLCGATAAGGTLALVAARNGPLFLVDVATSTTVAKHRPDAIDSQSRPPVVSGGRALSLLDDGRARVFDLISLKPLRTFRLAARPGTRPIPHDGGWLVVTPARIEVLDQDGVVRTGLDLPPGFGIRDVVALGGKIYVAAGEVGVLGVDPANPTVVTSTSAKFASALAKAPGGRLFVHRPNVGIVSLDPVRGDERVIVAHAGDRARIHEIAEGRFAALFDGEIVFFAESGPAGRAKVRGCNADAVVIVCASSGGAGVIHDGWCSLFEPSEGRCVAGFACEAGVLPAFVGRTLVNVHADGRLTLTDS